MTHDEMIAVIQAHKEGKEIEYRSLSAAWWAPTSAPCWDFNRYHYRVAKAKKVGYIAVGKRPPWEGLDGRYSSHLYFNKEELTGQGGTIVKVEWEE